MNEVLLSLNVRRNLTCELRFGSVGGVGLDVVLGKTDFCVEVGMEKPVFLGWDTDFYRVVGLWYRSRFVAKYKNGTEVGLHDDYIL
ncbi:hypothetical protein Lalb_Chr01g0008301 [Lupinus albus]|uniref:Uncharacterized protein n=1 Tax=Lupinus albus TaxID=3870 RepID=A0A6A4R4F7_LUPAL|nr:hypothetical protein Lalb_Chr01g0008301 [Lupinus albus]